MPLALTSATNADLAAALATLVALLAVAGFRRARGTTLAAPLAWAVASALVLALVEAALASSGPALSASTASLLRYAAAVGTFCPLMAVLGAKRPQDRGWQWIVLSLWIVLLVPAGQAWASRASGELQLAPMWRIMILALMTLTLLNYLPTSWAISTCIAAGAQWVLFKGWLFGYDEQRTLTAAVLFLIAAILPPVIKVGSREETKKGDGSRFSMSDDALAPYTQRWLAFRDAWGAFWALRILHRVNETATLSHWPVRLEWNGFVPVDPTPPQDQSPPPACPQSPSQNSISNIPLAHIEQTLDTLLRRFERT
jgi:hypothetical protein